MPDGRTLIRITIRGGGLAVVDGLAYAVILPPPHPAVWIASPAGDGTIRFTEEGSGRVLGVVGTEPGSQARALEVGPAVPGADPGGAGGGGGGEGAGARVAAGGAVAGGDAPAPGPAPGPAPVTGWRVSRCSDAGGGRPVAVKDPGELTSGYYAIEEPATGAPLHRDPVEEPDLRPKPVALQPVGLDQGPLILQVIDED
jgi:hypothetical protein